MRNELSRIEHFVHELECQCLNDEEQVLLYVGRGTGISTYGGNNCPCGSDNCPCEENNCPCRSDNCPCKGNNCPCGSQPIPGNHTVECAKLT